MTPKKFAKKPAASTEVKASRLIAAAAGNGTHKVQRERKDFRPVTMNYLPEILARIDQQAEAHGISRSSYIIDAVMRRVKRDEAGLE
jgi:hypothetical protein